MRKVALCIIMSFAGLGMDSEVLEKDGSSVLKLTCIPWLFDSVSMMVGCWLFMGYDLLFGLTVGLIIATCSPAVIVPGMMDLNAQKYGKKNGITTLMFGASSFEDIVAIATVTTIFNLKFPANNKSTIFDSFMSKEVLMYSMPLITLFFGIVPGMLLGWIVGHFTSKVSATVKGVIAIFVPLLSLVVYELIGIGGSNLLFSICFNAVLRHKWVTCDLQPDTEFNEDGTTQQNVDIFVKNKITRKVAVQEAELVGS